LSGVTHGDLHGGNILFIKNDDKPMFQIGLIDFGIVFRIDNIIKNKFLELTIDLYSRPAEEITAELLNLIIEPKEVWINIPKKHTDSIIALGADIIRQTIHSSSGATQIKLFEFVTRFNNYLKRNDLKMYGLEVDDNFVKLQLALAMSHGVSLCLCKNKYMDVANDVLNSMFHTDLLNE
jgi:predicted unusual protein kinase regulating ubiquinone biosynthesis (AarF/ABC1/UbiB family)